MFTIVTSRTTINWARPITARISQRRGSGASAALPAAACSPFGLFIADITLSDLEDLSPVRHERNTKRRCCLHLRYTHFMSATEIETGAQRTPARTAAPDPRPLRKDAERNRVRILEAAAEVFTEQGLRATLDDVAAGAGVGVGTVSRGFPDKEALVEALFTARLDTLVGYAEQAFAEPDPWTGL